MATIVRGATASLVVLATIFSFGAARASEAVWPQFRGPRGDGHAPGRNLPIRWSETENIAWKTPLAGNGWSSPVANSETVWLTAASDDGLSLRALALDFADGRIRHDVEVFRRDKAISKNAKNSFASPTPVLDDSRVYVHFGAQGTACLDQASGTIIWKSEELSTDHKEGPGSSPVLWHDLLFLTFDGMDVQYVAALDKATGRVRWKTPRSGAVHPNPEHRKAYATPLVVAFSGREQLISPGADRAIAYDPATGAELWKVEYTGFSNVPRPVLGPEFLYIITSFVRPELWAVRPGAVGDATATHVAWKQKKQMPQSPSPLVIDDAVYVISDKGIITCLAAADGTERWTERLGGNFSASPIYADGKIFLFDESGKAFLVRPGAKYELLGENQLDGRVLASPAVVGSSLLVRTDRALYRIEPK